MRPFWISECKDFSNSESRCHSDASRQILLNPTYGLGKFSFEQYQDSHLGGHLGYRNEKILAILNFYVTPMLPIKFRLIPTYGLGGDVVSVKNFKMVAVAATLVIGTERFSQF